MIAEDANFCPHCGAAQHSMTADPEPAEPHHPHHNHESHGHGHKQHDKEDAELLAKLEKTVTQRHLDPNAKWLFFINYVGRTAVILPFFAVGIYFEPYAAIVPFIYFIILAMIATLVHNHFVFDIEKDRLDIEYGIIHKRNVSVPFRQIQNVNITRSLIDRILGIAKLEVESAGSSRAVKREVVGGTRSRAEGFLPGLSMKDALMFHDLILTKAMHEQNRLDLLEDNNR
jgi:membrane protein YdbS with pleckstrin-like domain